MLSLPDPSMGIIGIDEAGRGALAGPVVAAAVYFSSKSTTIDGINDSKKLTAKQRAALYECLVNDPEVHYSVQMVHALRIDEINILQATYEAMHSCVHALQNIESPTLWVDGNRFLAMPGIPHRCIVGGDGKVVSIAAAGIIAKVTRDRYMEELDLEHPEYGWRQNKAYGTAQHRDAIREHGYSIHHRKSFRIKDLPVLPGLDPK